MKTTNIIISGAILLATTACSISKPAVSTEPITIELSSSAIPEERYQNLNRGLNLVVTSEIDQNSIIDNSELEPKLRDMFDRTNITIIPSVREFVETTLSSYISKARIPLNRDVNSDYKLRVNVREFKLVRQTNNGRATVVLEYSLYNTDGAKIFSKTARGRYIASGTIADGLEKAYDKAVAEIDWQAIADALTTHRHAEQEAQKQVTGDGDTALEHTIIRWFIDSAPKGADVNWRVVSSTPDVKNTNSTYLGTTPYETTESFDIRGLKFENSGNIQIEITCEKPGYLTQKRRFNLRQVIEQKEISAKFNLIKEE